MTKGRSKNPSRLLWIVVAALLVPGILAVDEFVLSDADEIIVPEFFSGDGAHFEYPDDWLPADVRTPGTGEWVSITPDRSTGNWIQVGRFQSKDAGLWGATEETFVAGLAYDTASVGGTITRQPRPVRVAGLPGLEVEIGGFNGERTGKPLEAKVIALFGAEASYRLWVQFDTNGREAMLAAWQAMLDTLKLRDAPATDVSPAFDQLLLVDFEGDPSPFESGAGDRGAISVVDGAYRIQLNRSGRQVSFGSFPVPVQAVTIDVDVRDISGQGDLDGFGLGCVDNRDAGYSVALLPRGLGVGVTREGGEMETLFLTDETGMERHEILRHLAITCLVDVFGGAQISVAVNGVGQTTLTHNDADITYFTAVGLIATSFSGNQWSIDIDSVDAHAPGRGDPGVP